MPRYLMSNHNTRYLRLGLLMLGWFILLEIVLRLPPIQSRLERYAQDPVWYSTYVPQRIKLIRDNPDADIWFVGSSSVMTAVNPAIVDPLLNKQTSIKHKSLNLGLVGMFYIETLENFLKNDFLTTAKPKVVVFGTFPVLFAYSPTGNIEDSPEYDAVRNHSTELDSQISRWLYDHFALYKFVHSARNVVNETPVSSAIDTPTGYINFNQSITDLDQQGASGTTNDLLEQNLIMVKHLHTTLQGYGIQMAFMNLPMYDPEMSHYPGGVSNYQVYISRLRSVMADERIPFLDVWQALEDKHNQHLPASEFMDVRHLNDDGATDVSPFIAQFVANVLEPASTTSP